MNISPELLARLKQLNPNQPFINDGASQYTPLYDIQGQGYDGPVSYNQTGIAVGDPYREGGGGGYSIYDLSGNDTGKTGEWQKDNWNYDTAAMLAAAGFGTAFGALAPGMAGGAGGFSSAGGEGIGSGIADGAGFDGAANPWATGFTDTGTAGGALDTGYAGSGAVTGAGGAAGAAGAGSGLSSFLPAGASSLLGPLATVAGGLLGSQGNNQTQTQTHDVPEWMKPFLTGQGGLLTGAQSLMQQQAANPQGWQNMGNVAQGLLSQPVAGNGFAQFQARPRFGGQ